MCNQVDGFRLSPSSGCTLHRRSYLSPLPRCRVTGDIIMSLSFSQHYKIKINQYYLPVWTCQPSESGCPLLICNTPMILRLPWALPASPCWSTTSPSAAATLVWQSVSSSPSQSPSRDIRCKETLHQMHNNCTNCTTWTRTWNRWKETKMNKATFLTPKDYLRIITKKPLLLTSLTQKDLIFKSNTRKNTIGFEKKKKLKI